VVLRAARLPFIDRVISETLAGKSSALIVDLHRAGTRWRAEAQREGIR